jgi:UDP-glucose 4-epimerase
VLATLEEVSGMQVRKRNLPATPGDPKHAVASINLARERLGWEPRVTLRDGLTQQWEWFQEALGRPVKTAG